MPPKLLLADDSVTVQRVIAYTFAGEGFEVVAVGDGDEAVDRIERERPDIVLADLSMPGRDGYGVAEYVKRSPVHVAHTRVVLLTGAFEPVEESRSRTLGIDGVLAKPFDGQVAIGLVKRLLAQAPLAPSAPGRGAGDSDHEPRGAGGSATSMQTAGATGESRLATDLPAGPATDERTDGPGSGVAVDDYFRRLDEALISAGLEASPAVRTMATEGADALTSDAETVAVPAPARREAVFRPAQAAELEQSSLEHTMSPESFGGAGAKMSPEQAGTAPAAPSGPAVSLVDAFAALLAIEEGREPDVQLTGLAGELETPRPAGVDLDALADAVARRVLQKMTDARVRDIVSERVLEVAERLVREEIDRIKAEAT